jgi:hypothetical protein
MPDDLCHGDDVVETPLAVELHRRQIEATACVRRIDP